MDKQYKTITRSSEPTEQDTAQYGTICEIIKNGATIQLYIQLSPDEDKPNWMPFRFQ